MEREIWRGKYGEGNMEREIWLRRTQTYASNMSLCNYSQWMSVASLSVQVIKLLYHPLSPSQRQPDSSAGLVSLLQCRVSLTLTVQDYLTHSAGLISLSQCRVNLTLTVQG